MADKEIWDKTHKNNSLASLELMDLCGVAESQLFVKSYGLQASNEKPKAFMLSAAKIEPLVKEMHKWLQGIGAIGAKESSYKAACHALCGRHNGVSATALLAEAGKHGITWDKLGVVHPLLVWKRDAIIEAALEKAANKVNKKKLSNTGT